MDQITVNFIPTYKLITDNISESNMLYQIQLTQVFNLNQYDDTIINTKINNLYQEIKYNKYIILFIQNIKNKNSNIILDDITCFKLLFSYDCFNNFIKCLFQLKNKKTIQNVLFNNVINSIK
tara:strand:- start:2263 stop:2628 length:366 start_codon:yes stop_codon:yes gene_type:complete